MNKLTKRIVSVFLAVAMIVTILPPVTAQAAKTKSVVLYKGEVVEVSDNFIQPLSRYLQARRPSWQQKRIPNVTIKQF